MSDIVLGLLILIGFLAFAMLPCIIAACRRHRSVLAICVLTVLCFLAVMGASQLGGKDGAMIIFVPTFMFASLFWFVALIWSFTGNVRGARWVKLKDQG